MLFTRTLLPILSLVAASLAAPSQQVPRGDEPCDEEGVIQPTSTYAYDISSGAIDCHTAVGTVSKSAANAGHDITALVTFTYPAAAAGRNCRIDFMLSDDATVQGNGMMDVYTTWRTAPGCAAGFGQGGGNARDNNIGRLHAVKGEEATVVESGSLTRPCKAPGTVETFELVGVSDNVLISWDPMLEGLALIIE